MVTDVRIIFNRLLGFKDWTSERMLKKANRKKKVPDGVVSDGTHHFVIEVERTLKNKRYYNRIFTDYSIHYDPKYIILYITDNDSDMRWLMKQAEGWKRIYFVTMDKLIEMYYGITFINADGKEFRLDRIASGGVLFYDPEREEPEEDDFEEFRRGDKAFQRFLDERGIKL